MVKAGLCTAANLTPESRLSIKDYRVFAVFLEVFKWH